MFSKTIEKTTLNGGSVQTMFADENERDNAVLIGNLLQSDFSLELLNRDGNFSCFAKSYFVSATRRGYDTVLITGHDPYAGKRGTFDAAR